MKFESEYLDLVARFTVEIASSSHAYLAPGDSAREMVVRMQEYADLHSLSLPMIRVLSHDESWLLYGRRCEELDMVRALVSDCAKGTYPQVVNLLEDHIWSGEKIRSTTDKLQCDLGMIPKYHVMVARNRRTTRCLPNTKVFAFNERVTTELNNTFEKHRSWA